MKVEKKKLEAIVALTGDLIIAGDDNFQIVESVTSAYIALGYDAVKAREIANRTVQNTLDSLEGDRRLYHHINPSTVDLDNEYEMILFIRDLFNLQELLGKEEMDKELLLFIQKLKAHGWGDKQVHDFITKAGQNTNFEHAKNTEGKRVIPRQIPERGDRKEYLRNRFRLSK
jgi:hypothetical protein